jgi:hypothetical protein
VAAVEGEVPLVRRLQVGRHPVRVNAGEHVGQQAEPNPCPWAACSVPKMNRYQWDGSCGCRSSMRMSPPNTDAVRQPRNRISGGSSRSRCQRDSCPLPGGGTQTAAAAPSPVIQISSCGKASLRRRNSMKAGRTARRRCSSGEQPGDDRVILEGRCQRQGQPRGIGRGCFANRRRSRHDLLPSLTSTGRLASYPPPNQASMPRRIVTPTDLFLSSR